MTAIFGTPLAAILLAIEVLLFEWKPRSFVPVVVSVLVASAWRPLLIGIGPMFPFAGVALEGWWPPFMAAAVGVLFGLQATLLDRKSVVEGTSVAVRVELGGRRSIKKKKKTAKQKT